MTTMRPARVCALAVATLLAAALPAAAFSAKFSWKGISACASTSPAFALSGVPKGTTALGFVMHDEQAPDFQHGGSTVPYAGGSTVPKGSVTFVGPCPPPGEVHRYVWTIEARDRAGTALGKATAAGRFPP